MNIYKSLKKILKDIALNKTTTKKTLARVNLNLNNTFFSSVNKSVSTFAEKRENAIYGCVIYN